MSEDSLQSANSVYKSSNHIQSDFEQESLLGEHRVKPYYTHKPVDHYNCTYIIFFILGVGASLPWNFFCTAKHYWIFKFRNCTDAPLIERHDVSDISDYFESYFSIASAVPSVPCLILNFFLVNRVSSKVRILSSLVVMLLIFILTAVLAKIDTSAWTKEFFVLTLSCVVILSGASNILAASIFGVTGQFPMKNSQALISGQAMGGTISALAAILDLTVASNVTDSALAYFLTAVIFTLICIIMYLILPRMEYSRYYLNISNDRPPSSSLESASAGNSHSTLEGNSPPIGPILRKVRVLATCLFYNFFISIIIFPTISASIESVNSESGSIWTTKYFTPITCFFIYNFADFCGRQITAWIQSPGPNSKILPTLVFLRTLFIPLFMFCNYQPRKHINKVLFQSDVYPVLFISLLGLSNGYLGTLSMIYGPKVVPKELAEGTAIIMSFFLGLGLAVGSAFSSLAQLI
ncbi:equilibrative nucleoside transporter 3 [Xenopus laevis]|uniref:Equilibrative nucleoside transporter 3 n=1 Tax=Xenopus laevis TaxID=8355 RepID=A0A8J0TC82_XENLA|nr:equilibrative nucleoside transporter 3 [Xenopus laevis]